MWIGNHPAYLHGHPKYDIDVFLGAQVDALAQEAGLASAALHGGSEDYVEVDRDAAFREQAIQFIRSDIPGFVYRLIVKAYWHALSLEKVPNYTAWARFDPSQPAVLIERDIDVVFSLPYVVYRAFLVPGIVLAVVQYARRQLDPLVFAFAIPYVAMIPMVCLTFPDTRFKLAAEALVAVPACFAYLESGLGRRILQRARVWQWRP